jgi:hypothetical protein
MYIPLLVILSEAKDLRRSCGEILRFAQDDKGGDVPYLSSTPLFYRRDAAILTRIDLSL